MHRLLDSYQQQQSQSRHASKMNRSAKPIANCNTNARTDSNRHVNNHEQPSPLAMDVDIAIDLRQLVFPIARTMPKSASIASSHSKIHVQPSYGGQTSVAQMHMYGNSNSNSNNQTNTTHNNNNNNILAMLAECADESIQFGNSHSDSCHQSEDSHTAQSIYQFPEQILKFIPEYSMEWRWLTAQQHAVKLSNKHTQMTVNHSEAVSVFSAQCVGTASVGVSGTDNFAIYPNEHYLFEFEYLSSPLGAVLDAIIGITDSHFKLDANSLGVGNQSGCLNWGVRSDGIVCANNQTVNLETDSIGTRFKHRDMIAIRINTLNNKVCVQFSINNVYKIDLDLSERFQREMPISFPLKVTASAARGGGFCIVHGYKLK